MFHQRKHCFDPQVKQEVQQNNARSPGFSCSDLSFWKSPSPCYCRDTCKLGVFFQILQFTGIEHVCTYAHQRKTAGCTWAGLFSLLSGSPWAHYKTSRHTLDCIVPAISVPLLQGIKIPSSSGSHNTPTWINLNFSEKEKKKKKITETFSFDLGLHLFSEASWQGHILLSC